MSHCVMRRRVRVPDGEAWVVTLGSERVVGLWDVRPTHQR